ncbi:MAG: tRNA (adenosine(37)-N6)-dimethylallyltransferase MiaA [Bacteroidetes bacterium]|nr:tRNA (adenosine(37)-N6)-dimethylallyltransferase MiaA [Bacteroidota bacterium]
MPDTGTPIIVLAGPTASGKTDTGIALAQRIDAEIISADSRQVYRGLDIGTAKPTREQLLAVRHHGIDICTPDDTYTAGRFLQDAGRWADEIRSRGKRVLLVGGTGLYIRAFVDGLFEGPTADPALRAQFEKRIREQGLGALVEDLRALDPQAAADIDTKNPVRIIRALEVCMLTGQRYSVLRLVRRPGTVREAQHFGLRWERSALHRRIGLRVEEMIEAGLVEEVQRLRERGVDRSCTAMNAVGYPEILAYLEGLSPLADSIDAIKAGTRQYARRQMTWFRKESRLRWVDVEEGMSAGDIAGRVLSMVEES